MRKATPSLRQALRRRPARVCDSRQIQTHAALDGVREPTVKMTTLPNKIRVATENTPGHFSAVGLYVDAGARYETPSTLGVSHFLDRMAFKATTSRSDLDMALDMDKLGGQILCSSSREAIMYQSSHFKSGTPLALSLIADTVQHPAFLPEDLEAQRDAAHYELREVNSKPEMMLPEVLHHVAYGATGLGNPLLCPEERIEQIDEGALRTYLSEWYRPERMVIAGAGIHHDELVEMVDKYFSGLKYVEPSKEHVPSYATGGSSRVHQQPPAHLLPSSSPSSSINKFFTRAASSYLYPSHTPPPAPASTYVGGHRFVPSPRQSHSSEPNMSHLYLAFEGPSIHDPDVYALATIQILLGGGGSFSAGGPGKGMYSRLYTHILNHYPQIDHCASFNHIYTDSALFGLFATFLPRLKHGRGRRSEGNTAGEILPHLVHQLSLLLYTPVPQEELERAKNQLKSSLMMALESRSVEVEDLGRQILVHNRKVPVQEMCDRIDEVDGSTIKRVAHRFFGPESKNPITSVVMAPEDLEKGECAAVLSKYGVGGH